MYIVRVYIFYKTSTNTSFHDNLVSGVFFSVLFGSTSLFAFHHPQDLNRQEKKKKVIPAPSYESALSEVVKNNFTGIDVFRSDMLFYTALVLAFSDAEAYHGCGRITKI